MPVRGEGSNVYYRWAVLKKHRDLKKRAVEYKGGRCEVCGYAKSVAALDFHHVDPSQKDFAISSKVGKWDRIKQELDKCRLLCANCHREEHWQGREEHLLGLEQEAKQWLTSRKSATGKPEYSKI